MFNTKKMVYKMKPYHF